MVTSESREGASRTLIQEQGDIDVCSWLMAQQICLRRMNTDDQVCEATTKGTTICITKI
jgi:hypothetical protein